MHEDLQSRSGSDAGEDSWRWKCMGAGGVSVAERGR